MSALMKALSIRQPWAWLVANGYKDIENRSWRTKYRGEFLIHAAKGMTLPQYNDAKRKIAMTPELQHIQLPPPEDLERGGIVGYAHIVGCIDPMNRKSPWHEHGNYGFKIQEAFPLKLIELKGSLSFFDVDDSVVREALRQMVAMAKREPN